MYGINKLDARKFNLLDDELHPRYGALRSIVDSYKTVTGYDPDLIIMSSIQYNAYQKSLVEFTGLLRLDSSQLPVIRLYGIRIKKEINNERTN